jgi:hypothetical protein
VWVVQPPGYLDDLDAEGRSEWQARVTRCIGEAIGDLGPIGPNLRLEVGEPSAGVSVQWTGFPERVAFCLSRSDALELFDAAPAASGTRALQEEYLEWRVVREGSQIQRIEMTTELPEYWAVLAAHAPERLLALVAEFTGQERGAAGDVFGGDDVRDPDVSPAERELGFRERMLGTGTSPYNDGRRAICCMRQQSNTLSSLAALAAAASTPRLVADSIDGRIRSLRCSESIPLFLRSTAQIGRASDPLLVERLGQLAFEGREIAIDSPLGLYIQNVEAGRLLAPDGSNVPEEWFQLSRGGLGPDRRRRFQRLVLEVPSEEGYCVSDLVDLATEQPIRHGGEIADLVTVALFLRVSERQEAPVPAEPLELPAAGVDDEGCRELRARYLATPKEAGR